MFLAMLVVKVILVICFLCVGFLCNWLNADRSQNCEKIDRNIPSIFRLSVLVRKYCYTSDTKQVPPQLKFKNLLLLLLLCGDVASNPGPTNFGFVNCRSIRNKGPLLHDLIKCGDLDILGLVETHIRPNDTDGLLSSLTLADYNFIQKPRCTGRGGGVGFLCRKTFSPSIVSSPVFRSFEIIKACFLQMRDLRRIRKYLTPEVAVLAANALVSSRLDYCNSLFRGLSGFNQHKLQSIQNTLARIVTNHRKYAHVTPILQKLHWLPVKYRCIFKTATLVYKFLHSGSPSYFKLFLSFSSCPYSTRHSHPDRQYLTVPPFHSSVFKSAKHFGHSFAFDAPKIWNDLPQDVRSATSVASFRKKLKTYLFAKAYPP